MASDKPGPGPHQHGPGCDHDHDHDHDHGPRPEPFRHAQPKVGRNDPCPCGSGRKFKKCHGGAPAAPEPQ